MPHVRGFQIRSRHVTPAEALRLSWEVSPLSGGANLEPLSVRLQGGIRFLQHLHTYMTTSPYLPFPVVGATPGFTFARPGESYRLTTFR